MSDIEVAGSIASSKKMNKLLYSKLRAKDMPAPGGRQASQSADVSFKPVKLVIY